ncbi:MAG: DUF3592 domain-containing protein [Chitinophagaceae bacterium]
MNLPRIEGVVAVVLGIILIIAGVIQQKKKKQLLENGIEAEGEVLDIVGDKIKNPSGYPIIRFATKEMEWITEQYKVSIPFNKKGQKVTVLYNADNPKQFIVKKIF